MDPEMASLGCVQQTLVTSDALRCLIEGKSGRLDARNQHWMEEALNAGERAMAERGLLSDQK